MAFEYLTGTIVPISDRQWAEAMPLGHFQRIARPDALTPCQSDEHYP